MTVDIRQLPFALFHTCDETCSLHAARSCSDINKRLTTGFSDFYKNETAQGITYTFLVGLFPF